MPRPLRPIDKGLIYHVINRGNNRQNVFDKPEDFEAFLRSMRDLKERRPFELYGYCLMTNHIHLLIKPLETAISRVMQSLLVSHTQRYHRHYKSGGHLWQGRFKSPVVQGDGHLLRVLRYIEANPVKAGMVDRAGDYAWSSFAAHGLGEPNDLLDPAPAYQRTDNDPKARGRKWSSYVHRRPDEDELQAIARSIESGLPYGSETWIKALSGKLKLDLTIRPRGRPRKQPLQAVGTKTAPKHGNNKDIK